MSPDEGSSTCWTLIRGAAEGSPGDRERFARRYEPIVRAYLAARWKSPAMRQAIDDASQEVFAECLRRGGPLDRADPDHPDGFRPFLLAVARNVARRFEKGATRPAPIDPDELPDGDEAASRAFDRAWVHALLAEAAEIQKRRAEEAGGGAPRRVELLRLRFGEGRPIREIARLWDVEPAHLTSRVRPRPRGVPRRPADRRRRAAPRGLAGGRRSPVCRPPGDARLTAVREDFGGNFERKPRRPR